MPLPLPIEALSHLTQALECARGILSEASLALRELGITSASEPTVLAPPSGVVHVYVTTTLRADIDRMISLGAAERQGHAILTTDRAILHVSMGVD